MDLYDFPPVVAAVAESSSTTSSAGGGTTNLSSSIVPPNMPTIMQPSYYDRVPPAAPVEVPQSSAAGFTTSKKTSSAVMADEMRPYCRALYDFKSGFAGELSFTAGEIIYLLRTVNEEWLEGEVQGSGQRGLLPASYVQVVVPLDEPPPQHTLQPSIFNSTTTSADMSGGSSENQQSSIIIGVASVLYDFDARYDDELGVKTGDSLNVLELPSQDWALCQNPVSFERGLVPQAFLNIFLLNESGEQQLTDDDEGGAPSGRDRIELSVEKATVGNAFGGAPLSSPRFLGHQENEIPWIENTWNSSSPSRAPETRSSAGQTLFHPPLPTRPFNFGLFEEDSGAGMERSAVQAPPRPPPPKILPSQPATKPGAKSEQIKMVPQKTHEDFPLASAGVNFGPPQQQPSSGDDNKKDRVVAELLSTEQIYLAEISAWEECIKASSELTPEDQATLTGSLPALCELSQELIDAINRERQKLSGDQCYGQMFMRLRERFFKTFAMHFRCVEQISAIVENEADTAVQKALASCLKAMRQKGMTVFDVPTMVSRPIQRCLKYPLYLGELIKNTPLNHHDHPKLLESLKQLSNLATKMNECKRRKELVRKYKHDEQLSLVDKLSKLNMHTLRKKGNRLKYRIASKTIGFGTIKDSEFEYLTGLLEEAERRVCKFIYLAQLYRKHLDWSIRHHEESYKNLCPPQNEDALKAFALMFRSADEIAQTHLCAFETEVLTEGKRLVCGELTKLIRKRNDKLADFETARSASATAPEELDMKKNEFEALNNQVKIQLPRTIGTLNTRVVELVQRLRELDSQFIVQMEQWYVSQRPPLVKQFAPQAEPFTAFIAPQYRQTLNEMDRIRIQLSAKKQPSNEQLLVLRQHSTLPPGQKLPLKLIKKRLSMRNPPIRQQTVKERDALVKICRVQGQTNALRRVLQDFTTDTFVVRTGDVVLIKSHHNGYSLCDNGVSMQHIPVAYLGPFDESFALLSTATGASPKKGATSGDTVKVPSARQQSLEAAQQIILFGVETTTKEKEREKTKTVEASAPKSETRRKSNTDLIDLEQNLIDFVLPSSTTASQMGTAKNDSAGKFGSSSTTGLDFDPFAALVTYEREPGNIGRRASQPASGYQIPQQIGIGTIIPATPNQNQQRPGVQPTQNETPSKNWTALFDDDWALISPVAASVTNKNTGGGLLQHQQQNLLSTKQQQISGGCSTAVWPQQNNILGMMQQQQQQRYNSNIPIHQPLSMLCPPGLPPPGLYHGTGPAPPFSGGSSKSEDPFADLFRQAKHDLQQASPKPKTVTTTTGTGTTTVGGAGQKQQQYRADTPPTIPARSTPVPGDPHQQKIPLSKEQNGQQKQHQTYQHPPLPVPLEVLPESAGNTPRGGAASRTTTTDQDQKVPFSHQNAENISKAQLVPVRAAPALPGPPRRSKKEQTAGVTNNILEERGLSSSKEANSKTVLGNTEDMMVCAYDFEVSDDEDTGGGSNLQLPLCEGEHVQVLQRGDDAGNTEWWLVRASENRIGFVPASYLVPLNNRVSEKHL